LIFLQRKGFEASVFTEFICIFVVVNNEYKILQTMCKVTNIFSEIVSFFQKSSKISAVDAISSVMKNVIID